MKGNGVSAGSLGIIPRIGIRGLAFGATKAEAMRFLGVGVVVRVFEDGDVHLESPRLGVALFFSAEAGDRLIGAEVDAASNASLWERSVFGLTLGEIEALVDEHLELPDKATRPGVSVVRDGPDRILRVSALDLDFYFDATGRLKQINWGSPGATGDEVG